MEPATRPIIMLLRHRLRRSIAGLPLLGLLACGSPDRPAPEATEPEEQVAAGDPTTSTPEPRARDALAGRRMFEEAALNFRLAQFPDSWRRVESFEPLPEAAVVLENPPASLHFAVIPLALGDPGPGGLPAARQAALDYLRRRARIVETHSEMPHDLKGLATTLTVAEGVLGNRLVRLADLLLLASDRSYHLLTWGPLLETDSETLVAAAVDLALHFELIDPSRAVASFQASTAADAGEFVRFLDVEPVDAVFSRALDRLVVVTEEPPALHLIDPASLEMESIALELVPLRIALRPDGRQAAVAHPGRLSLVDLDERRRVTSRSIGIEPGSLVFTSRGWVYLAQAKQSGFESIVGARLPGATRVESKGMSIAGDASLRLHPGGKALYVANRGSYPDALEKLDISDGTPHYLYRWPYHGDHSPCGDLWISADGRRIFTACGALFKASSVRSRDMVYDGRLQDADFIQSFEECAQGGYLLTVAGSRRGLRQRLVTTDEVRVYDAASLTVRRVDRVPPVTVEELQRPAVVRWIFAAEDCRRYHAVVRLAAPEAGSERYGLFTRSLG